MGSKVYENGIKEWKLPNGFLHREDGPAVEYSSGYKAWYLNGEKHRKDGPTVEYNGTKVWYLNGIEYTEQDYKHKMMSRKLTKLLK